MATGTCLRVPGTSLRVPVLLSGYPPAGSGCGCGCRFLGQKNGGYPEQVPAWHPPWETTSLENFESSKVLNRLDSPSPILPSCHHLTQRHHHGEHHKAAKASWIQNLICFQHPSGDPKQKKKTVIEVDDGSESGDSQEVSNSETPASTQNSKEASRSDEQELNTQLSGSRDDRSVPPSSFTSISSPDEFGSEDRSVGREDRRRVKSSLSMFEIVTLIGFKTIIKRRVESSRCAKPNQKHNKTKDVVIRDTCSRTTIIDSNIAPPTTVSPSSASAGSLEDILDPKPYSDLVPQAQASLVSPQNSAQLIQRLDRLLDLSHQQLSQAQQPAFVELLSDHWLWTAYLQALIQQSDQSIGQLTQTIQLKSQRRQSILDQLKPGIRPSSVMKDPMDH
ncbi:hypothetical protein PGT21_004692 [Puccinia graminis f. sp. tritici]|uniref:Uncharacterized protein n=1 Tax=Puccinia graminis f. sp. tritici TaxID=56615 RepID=A0A5B0N2U9_PUCGR|nr:hypothetical protein PGTUg99_036029 [Puccinia graminis f. sp. tritici]KAA1093964.1 hypothetical protein PGT21_004692 [Puccinia graminis f. sp. tritici]